MMLKDNKEVLTYINNLKDYEGYVQFSDEPLRKVDIFEGRQDINVTPTKGFVYEAHFCNGTQSIMIRQQNAEWVVSITYISEVKPGIEITEEFYALEKTSNLKEVKSNWVKMAQIWKPQKDKLCEDMEVMKLQKVVFAGFAQERGES